MLNLYRAVFLFVVNVAIVYLGGSQINHRIRLKFLNMIFLTTNYHEGKKKNPNDRALKFEHFHL